MGQVIEKIRISKFEIRRPPLTTILKKLSYPIRVAHLITELNVGGAEQMLYKLVTRMNPDRFRSIVLSMTDLGPIGEKIAEKGIPVFPLGMSPGKPSLRGSVKLFRCLKQESVDIVQTWLYHADLLGLMVGRMAEVKRVVWGIRCSNMDLGRYRSLTDLTFRVNAVMSSLVDAIVVNSVEGKEVHSASGYETKRMIVIPNGFDTELFQPNEESRNWLRGELRLNEEAVLIGLVARWDPMKDQKTFLSAASILAETEKSAHFVLVGRGMDDQNRKLLRYIDQPVLKGRVHLLGLRHDAHRIMAGLDIATSSSAFGEGFSNTVGEAMSCGVPCVVTNVGDSPLVVGDTGVIVPCRDPGALAQGWKEIMLLGKAGRRALGEKARQRILDSFELGKVVGRFEEFYAKLAA